jgi:hypothetical protein
MLTRREMLSAGLLQTMPGSVTPTVVVGDQATERIIQALDRIEREIRNAWTTCGLPVCPEVDTIRVQQRTFLRGHQKFPDFIEVGITVWERVYDWHVRTLQPVTVTRREPGAFYTMTMAAGPTRLILRPDVDDRFVGFPYDEGAA